MSIKQNNLDIQSHISNSISIDTWFNIINGSMPPDNTSKEQFEANKIRNMLVEKPMQYIDENIIKTENILITEKENLQYKEERERLLQRLKKEKLFNLTDRSINTKPFGLLQATHQTSTHKSNFLSFFLTNKKAFGSAILITLSGFIAFSFLYKSNIDQKSIYASINISKNAYPDLVANNTVKKNITSKALENNTDVPKYKVDNPKEYAEIIKKELEEANLTITLKKHTKGWLISTDLRQNNINHNKIRNIIKEFSLSPPIGSSHLKVLFVQK